MIPALVLSVVAGSVVASYVDSATPVIVLTAHTAAVIEFIAGRLERRRSWDAPVTLSVVAWKRRRTWRGGWL